jgi:nucleoside-diphosphate-sugar epimerase
MERITVAIAGGSGFIGRAIVRHLGDKARVRVLTRNPDAVRARLGGTGAEFVRADVTDAASLEAAMAGAQVAINAAQFNGYPIENPRRGLTFERVDYGGTVAMIAAARKAGVGRIIYISGAAADEQSRQPGFRAKGRAERAIRESGQSGLDFTMFRPSLVYGADDRVTNLLARAIKYAPVFAIPGTGKQVVQPVAVEDLAACVAMAVAGRGRNGTFAIGGPEPLNFDELIRLMMDLSGHHRPIVHIPEGLMRVAGRLGEMLPRPLFSRDAVDFLTADNPCDNGPLIAEFGIRLTPARVGMSYLKPKG